MIRGLYGAATGLDSAERQHEVISQNLAHVDVPGYRRRGVAFETFDRALAAIGRDANDQDLHGTRIAATYNGFESGPIVFTGSPFDVAINGDAFFVVKGPEGPLYTRNGTFTLSGDGELQTRDGRTVNGADGPITVPPNTREILIGYDGTVSADGIRVGQLQLARFQNPNALVPVGTTLFAAPAGVAAQGAGTARLVQGYREQSNVQPVNEMVSLIANMRHMEASQRVLRSISEALQLNTRPQGAA